MKLDTCYISSFKQPSNCIPYCDHFHLYIQTAKPNFSTSVSFSSSDRSVVSGRAFVIFHSAKLDWSATAQKTIVSKSTEKDLKSNLNGANWQHGIFNFKVLIISFGFSVPLGCPSQNVLM